MENLLEERNVLNNNISNENNIEIEQKNFLETSLGKIVNTAINVGLRFVLPDLIENQIIDIKDTLITNGLKEGISETIEKSVNFGKSVVGNFNGKFENIEQIQSAIGKGGIIDSISNLIDFVVDKSSKGGKLSSSIATTIKQGKNILLDNISSNIENLMSEQVKKIENLDVYENDWNKYYNNRDLNSMEKEYIKIKNTLSELVPLENKINLAKKIINIHDLIKNNGGNFNISENEIKLAEKLAN